MAFTFYAPLSLSSSVSVISSKQEARKPIKKKQKAKGLGGSAAGNILEVVKKDVNFIQKGFCKGVEWANSNLRVPQVVRSIDDFIWLRYVENPLAVSPIPKPSLPQPYYPELSGIDLFIADLNALEAYARYFYHLSRTWTKPLPEVYDPQEVVDYFNLRPHVVAFRFFEI